MKKIYGVGYNSAGKYDTHENGKTSAGYLVWHGMMRRCYSTKRRSLNMSYEDCNVDERFHDYQKFMDWAVLQDGYGLEGYQLDKDLLVKNNRVYNPDTCVFIPKEINTVIVLQKRMRGELPIGVCGFKGRYQANISHSGRNIALGIFNTSDEAFKAYKLAKEARVKVIAEKYKATINPKAYNALLNWQVQIDD